MEEKSEFERTEKGRDFARRNPLPTKEQLEFERAEKAFVDDLHLRTGESGNKFRKEFINELKLLGVKKQFLKVTEERGKIHLMMKNWTRINESRYGELRNWYLKLKKYLVDKRFITEAINNNYHLSKYMCHNCGADLLATEVDSKKIRYCSEECRKAGPRDRKRRWREKNYDKHIESQKRYYSSI